MTWERELHVECVVCPDCGFTFDALHTDDNADGGYTCPQCSETTALAAIAEREGVVFVRVTRELVPQLREWTRPVRLRVEDSHRPGEAVLVLEDVRPVLEDDAA